IARPWTRDCSVVPSLVLSGCGKRYPSSTGSSTVQTCDSERCEAKNSIINAMLLLFRQGKPQRFVPSLLVVCLMAGSCGRSADYYLQRGNELATAGKYEEAS